MRRQEKRKEFIVAAMLSSMNEENGYNDKVAQEVEASVDVANHTWVPFLKNSGLC